MVCCDRYNKSTCETSVMTSLWILAKEKNFVTVCKINNINLLGKESIIFMIQTAAEICHSLNSCMIHILQTKIEQIKT